MIHKMGCDFNNLPQRMMYYFLATYPPFYAVDSKTTTFEQQKAAYDFILNLYRKLYDDPTLLGFKIVPDDSFGEWEPQKAKPDLVPKMRGMIKKTDEFFSILHKLVLLGNIDGDTLTIKAGDLELKTPIIKQLGKFGMDSNKTENGYICSCPHDILVGLKLLAEISAADDVKPYLLFSRGVFDPSSPYTVDIFRELSGDTNAYNRLINFFDKNGYRRVDNRWHCISLDYVKNYGNKDDEIKSNWAERTHGGIEFWWEEIRHNQLLIGLRIPYFMDVLKQMDTADDKVRQYVVHQSKKCDNCGYCTQTDKTGTRPKVYVPVKHGGNTYNICPLFCGFQHRWHSLDSNIVENITTTLSFIDTVLKDK